jgi:hypothetical protein
MRSTNPTNLYMYKMNVTISSISGSVWLDCSAIQQEEGHLYLYPHYVLKLAVTASASIEGVGGGGRPLYSYLVLALNCARECGGGGVWGHRRGGGPRHLLQSPFTGHFLDNDIWHCILSV